MAETLFGDFIVRLSELGFLDFFLPFVLTAAISFALLRKSKILGDNLATNALASFVVGMLVMALPVLTNISFTEQFSTFFVQVTMLIVGLIVAAIIASMFFPNLGALLGNFSKNPLILGAFFIVAVLILLISGLFGVFTDPTDPDKTGIEPDVPGPPSDVIILVAVSIVVAVLIIVFVLASSMMAKGR